jgi:hypothetical protein
LCVAKKKEERRKKNYAFGDACALQRRKKKEISCVCVFVFIIVLHVSGCFYCLDLSFGFEALKIKATMYANPHIVLKWVGPMAGSDCEYTNAYARAQTLIDRQTQVHTHRHIHTRTQTHVHTHTCTHLRTHTHVHTHTYTFTYTYTLVIQLLGPKYAGLNPAKVASSEEYWGDVLRAGPQMGMSYMVAASRDVPVAEACK